jgi:ABC-type transport system substrate-binding protein
VPVDSGQLRSMIYSNPPDPGIVGTAWVWPMPTMPVSVPYLLSAYHSKGNWRLLNDPKWDALYESIGKEPDLGKRITAFRNTINYVHDQYVALGIVNLGAQYAVSDKVGEWELRSQYDIWGDYVGMQRK